MSVIKFDRDFSTLFNWDTDENPTTEQDYQNAVKNWIETEMNIVDTLLWQPTTEYTTGNIVKTPSLPSQYVLRCAEAGTSGSTEPDYSGASVGDTVTDGSVEWVIVSLATGNAADVDASNIGINAEVDNSEAWGNAIGGGAIAEDDVRLVKGDTVYAVTSVMETNIATNTEAIEDNTENIATNTENIAQNTTDIDIAEKRIGNIEKLLQGQLYDYQTDSDSKYTKTVPQGAMPWASLNEVGGRTIVYNQLNDHSSTYNGTGLTVTRNADGSVTLNGTSTQSNSVYFTSSSKQWTGTFAIKGCPDGGSGTFGLGIGGAKNDTGQGAIVTKNGDFAAFRLNVDSGVTFNNVTIYPVIRNLTLMFGAGNEPTLAEYNAMFPNDNDTTYNAGTLLSAGVTEVVSKKADTTTIATYSIPAEIRALEGYGWSAGSVYNYIDYENKKFVQNVARVDLGTLNWTTASNDRFRADLSSVPLLADNNSYPIAICPKYEGATPNNYINYDDVFHFSSTIHAIYIRDTSYSDVATFTSAVSGVYMNYAIATPVETDISAYITDDNLIEVEAGGTLTFPNSNGTDYQIPVPSAETYMVDLQEAI